MEKVRDFTYRPFPDSISKFIMFPSNISFSHSSIGSENVALTEHGKKRERSPSVADEQPNVARRPRLDSISSHQRSAIGTRLRDKLQENQADVLRSTSAGAEDLPAVVQKFEIDDPRAVTNIETHCSLAGLYDELSTKDLRSIFGCENQPLTFVDTIYSRIADHATGNVSPSGSVCFSNLYGKSIWVMAENYRDPKQASFYMSDIVKRQAAEAGMENGPQYLVRKTLVSEDSKVYFAENDFSHMQDMNQTQFHDFMTKTVNGRSSERILNEFGLRAESARVLVINPNQRFSESDSDSEYEEDRTIYKSPAMLQTDTSDLEYSVVIVTAPLNSSSSPKQNA